MKIALVDLFVDLEGLTAQKEPTEESLAMRNAIRRARKTRKQSVIEALRAARKAGANAVVFPGWTLHGTTVPQSVLQETADLTVVLETFVRTTGAKRHTTCYVIRDRQIEKTIIQRFVQGKDVLEGSALSAPAKKLVDEILNGDRDVKIGNMTALVLLCGEVNLVGGGSDGANTAYHRDEVLAYKGNGKTQTLTAKGLSQRPLVINPAHTPTTVNAMRVKRSWLSSGGTLVTTANTRSAFWGWRRDKADGVSVAALKKGKHRAIQVFQSDRDVDSEPMALSADSSVKISYLDLP